MMIVVIGFGLISLILSREPSNQPSCSEKESTAAVVEGRVAKAAAAKAAKDAAGATDPKPPEDTPAA